MAVRHTQCHTRETLSGFHLNQFVFGVHHQGDDQWESVGFDHHVLIGSIGNEAGGAGCQLQCFQHAQHEPLVVRFEQSDQIGNALRPVDLLLHVQRHTGGALGEFIERVGHGE